MRLTAKLAKLKSVLPEPEEVLRAAGVVVFFLLLISAAAAAITLYQVVAPPRLGEDIRVEHLLGHPSVVVYEGPGREDREGWFFPGLRGAPVIILCPGYRSHRGETLTLASSLQENLYNVFLMDFPGHGKSDGFSSLGFRETGEVEAAIRALARRDDIDANSIGLWGTDMGAYAALAVASEDARVLAVAADSPFDSPLEMLRIETGDSWIATLPVVRQLVRWSFMAWNFSHRSRPPLSERVGRMNKTAKLFLTDNRAALAAQTRALFDASAEPRQMTAFAKTSYAMMADEMKREYDREVLSFFLMHMNPARRAR